MLTISKPALSRFRTGEHLQCMTTILDVYKVFDVKSLGLEIRVNELEQKITIMKDAFMVSKSDSVSFELRPVDEERISLLKGLKRFLQSEYYRPDVQKKKHAALLLKSYGRFCDGIDKFSFQHKTAVITKLIDAWAEEAEFVEAVNAIGAHSWVKELADTNESFYALYFSKAKSKLPVLQSNIMKADIKDAFDELISDTLAFARVFPDKTEYNKLIKELNGVIEANNQPVVNRRNRRRKETVSSFTPTLPAGVLDLNSY
ncbi:MAG: hypothetical protein IPF52_10030 [Saprospiraceae bacterium]|nr:hypothetical protein [Saprospiraceae bacterium]